MANCSSVCTPDLPVYLASVCGGQRVKKGGWSRAVFIKCGATAPVDPCDAASWLTLIQGCDVRITGELLGAKPAGSDTLLRTSSCSPEQPIGGTKTWTFSDFNSTLSLTEYSFWNFFKMNASQYKVGFLDCENRFYAFYNYGLSVDEVKDDNRNGTSRFEGTFTIEEVEILEPVRIPAATIDAMVAYQSYDCETATYLDDYSVSCESINLAPELESYTIDSGISNFVDVPVDLDRNNCATPTPLVLEFAGLPTGLTVALQGTVGVPTTQQTYRFTAVGTTPGTYRINISAAAGQTTCETNITHILLTII